MNTVMILGASPLTMSSREIAELTGKEHPNVMRDIRGMLEELGEDVLRFEDIYSDAYGREVESLAAERGMRATELDPNVWMFEAADDMGEWAVEQDEATLNQRLAAGRVKATGGGV